MTYIAAAAGSAELLGVHHGLKNKKVQQTPRRYSPRVVGLRFFRRSGLTACSVIYLRSFDLDAFSYLLHPAWFTVLYNDQQFAIVKLADELNDLPLLIADHRGICFEIFHCISLTYIKIGISPVLKKTDADIRPSLLPKIIKADVIYTSAFAAMGGERAHL